MDQPNPPVVHDLAIEKEDVCQWTRRDAFRHLYANWRSSIRTASHLQHTPELHLTETPTHVTVSNPVSSPGPGFIELDKRVGMLVLHIANGGCLRWYRDMHTHMHTGMGMDMGMYTGVVLPPAGLLKGVLAMVLAGYRVGFCGGGEVWEFFVHGEVLAFGRVVLGGPGPSPTPVPVSVPGPVPSEAGQNRFMPPDMTIVIGPGNNNTTTTTPPSSRRVERENLLRWLTVTLDISNMPQPETVMETVAGELLLDVSFADRVYVDGIQLATRHAGLFHFGYHYHDQSLVSEDLELVLGGLEAELRCQMWAEAIAASPSLATLLLGLLRAQPMSPDVRRVDEDLSLETVEVLRDCLMAEVEGCLVCCEMDDVDVITQRTNRPVVALPTPLWTALHRLSLLRTWGEDLLYRAPRAAPMPTIFSMTIQQTLTALLQTDPLTASSLLLFVDYPLTTPSVYFHDDSHNIYVSRYWLDFNAVHRALPCRFSDMNPETASFGTFRCDHVVLALYGLVVRSAVRCLETADADRDAQEKRWVAEKCRLAGELVEERPRGVSVRRAVMGLGDLCVMWQLGVPPHVADLVGGGGAYRVVLHREECPVWMCEFVHSPGTDFLTAPCGCPQKTVRQRLLAVFGHALLDPNTRYVPMVALNKPGSIYGTPPAPVSIAGPGPELPNPNPNPNPSSPDPDLGVSPGSLMRSFRESWQTTAFPVLFGLFTPPYGDGDGDGVDTAPAQGSGSSTTGAGATSGMRPVAVGENDRLGFRFERHRYIIVHVRGTGPLESRRYLLYVHGVCPVQAAGTGTGTDPNEGSLLVTVFSFLRTTSLCMFNVGLACDPRIGLRELLLHYSDVENMGLRQDAVAVPIGSILSVQTVSPRLLGAFDEVVYTVDVPPDVSRTPLYCRFAIRCGGSADAACVMPVASHLLAPSKRWPEPRYGEHLRPSLVDLSPGCLGLTEGFCQAGGRVDAAFGYDAARHHTWRARYPTAKPYDGPLASILADLQTQALNPPPQPIPGTPRILLLSIPDATWAEAQTQPTHILQSIRPLLTTLRPTPDFLVFTLPSWIFLSSSFPDFFSAVYALLENRYAVHLRRVRLADFGPVGGVLLVLVAACVPSPIPWDVIFAPVRTGTATGTGTATEGATSTVLSRIRDLDFLNPRVFASDVTTGASASASADANASVDVNASARSLVCRHPLTLADVYNHPTGLAGTTGQMARVCDLFEKVDGEVLRGGVRHYQRNDPLTVRELARCHGIPDDLIFHGSVAQQYDDVLNAFPPPVARDVAARIALVLREFRCRMDLSVPVPMQMSVPVPPGLAGSSTPVGGSAGNTGFVSSIPAAARATTGPISNPMPSSIPMTRSRPESLPVGHPGSAPMYRSVSEPVLGPVSGPGGVSMSTSFSGPVSLPPVPARWVLPSMNGGGGGDVSEDVDMSGAIQAEGIGDIGDIGFGESEVAAFFDDAGGFGGGMVNDYDVDINGDIDGGQQLGGYEEAETDVEFES